METRIIDEAFMKGVEAQKEIHDLPVPEGTNPTALDKVIMIIPIITFIFLPFVVLDLTDRSWIYFGLAMIPGMVGIFLVMHWLIRKIIDQNLAIEERDKAHLATAREEARRMLVDGATID